MRKLFNIKLLFPLILCDRDLVVEIFPTPEDVPFKLIAVMREEWYRVLGNVFVYPGVIKKKKTVGRDKPLRKGLSERTPPSRPPPAHARTRARVSRICAMFVFSARARICLIKAHV